MCSRSAASRLESVGPTNSCSSLNTRGNSARNSVRLFVSAGPGRAPPSHRNVTDVTYGSGAFARELGQSFGPRSTQTEVEAVAGADLEDIVNMATIAVVEAQGAHDAPQVQEERKDACCCGLNSFISKGRSESSFWRRINQWTKNF